MALKRMSQREAERQSTLRTMAAANRDWDYFEGYLAKLADQHGYSLSEAEQAYRDCLTEELTPVAAAEAPKWERVRAYLVKWKAVTDWEAQAGK